MEFKNPYLNGACSFPEKLRQKPSCRLMAKDLKLASVEAMVGKSNIFVYSDANLDLKFYYPPNS